MASLTMKTIKGRKYYYARVCKRIDGRPKIVQTIYLGSVEKMIERATRSDQQPIQPIEAHIAEFGSIAALLDCAQRLQFVEIVDRHVPKRKQGPSTGQYLLLAAINRASHPTSKARLRSWFEETSAPRLMGMAPRHISSQAFWNHMDRLQMQTIPKIENDLVRVLIDRFHIDLNGLLYDATNFYTYINTKTPGELAQRGHNKQKRNDLRQVSLSMMTSSDFHIPLLHTVYGGSINDTRQFASVIDELIQRYKLLAAACPHVTLIFDKGNNSEENFSALAQTGLHFVGSLKLNQCPDLLKVPLQKYRRLKDEGLQSVRTYRTRQKIFAEERTILVTHNENLLAGQLQGLGHNLEKTKRDLHDLQQKLRRRVLGKVTRGKKPTLNTVQNKVDKILQREHMKTVLHTELQEQQGGVHLTYRVDQNALARLIHTNLGKTILFTDNHEWSDEQIVRGYRAQYHIEHAFRDMKNPHFLGWNPRFHWTDQKICVHAFYCVAALTLVSLLRRELDQKGLSISSQALMENLNGIREITNVYPKGKQKTPTVASTLSHLNPTQKQLYRLLKLQRFRDS